MLVAGIDVGAATAKAVILGDGGILGYALRPTGHNVKLATNKVIKEALEKAGVSTSIENLNCVISTGCARGSIGFAHKTITEIICHAKGAQFMIPSTRFIIDMGGQDSKAIQVDPEGNVTNFIMNDKCAAGTGRFLEVMAQVLEVESIAEMGPLALQSKEPCAISSTCTVFAETEVVVLRAEGKDRKDLIAGVHKAVASRVAAMVSSLTISPDAVFTGGVAKNIGVRKFLEKEIGMELHVPVEPQIIGAFGAALFAKEAAE
jgi:predicted CoA-substrate-specific enzyme activase